ncbi:N6-adenosine-methyltransferase subunit mettl3 [Rhizophlyctis rosea]|nr:N6-adenosine-methyltransferase subunit mettl3 [Rhizophlyctis rosea]
MDVQEVIQSSQDILTTIRAKRAARACKRTELGISLDNPPRPAKRSRQPTTEPKSEPLDLMKAVQPSFPPDAPFLMTKAKALRPLRDYLNSVNCVQRLPMDSLCVLRNLLTLHPDLGIMCESNLDIIEDLISRSEFINGIRFLWLKRCNFDGQRRLVVVKVETDLPGPSAAESGTEKKWSDWDRNSPHVLHVAVEKPRPELAEVYELLDQQTYMQATTAAVMKDMMHMLQVPTAKTMLMAEKFKGKEECEFRMFCDYGLRSECWAKRPPSARPCKRLHFRRIMKPQTDVELGDCSYLNTCHRMEQCKYVHYELDEEGLVVDIERPIALSGMGKPLPPQWIRCDVRKFDLSILGQFSVIMADPPWDIHMTLPYGTMTDDEMKQMAITSLQDEGVLFLWVTGRAMELGRECMALWGYNRVDELVWVKTMQLQRLIRTGRTGHWINHSKEHCLIGIKGNPKICRGLDSDVLVAEVRETSRKPDEIYGLIDRMSPGTRKIEIFGRQHNTRAGWTTLGNQLEGVRLYEKDVVERYNKVYPDAKATLSEIPAE